VDAVGFEPTTPVPPLRERCSDQLS